MSKELIAVNTVIIGKGKNAKTITSGERFTADSEEQAKDLIARKAAAPAPATEKPAAKKSTPAKKPTAAEKKAAEAEKAAEADEGEGEGEGDDLI